MDFKELLSVEIQSFINKNIETNLSKLAFQKNPFSNIDFKELINQIEAKKKSKTKLPIWFTTNNIIYPNKISVEQTSSQSTAKYKSQIINGNSIIDLTGGFGVDCYYFSNVFKKVTHCEINEELSKIVAHNFNVLSKKNIECIVGDSYEFLKSCHQKFDWIFIDPSRRNETKGKVFMLKDCLPDVPENLDFYFNFSDKILIKTAPILDITAGLNELKNVKKIHIVAVNNEVKELLWEIEKGFIDIIEIITLNILDNNEEQFNFYLNTEKNYTYSLPKTYLYEPNAAIMKSNGFSALGTKFKLEKLHVHSHLFTATFLQEFPGRIFKIEKVVNYNKQEMKHLTSSKANVTTRNFPESVDVIKKKWKINDGGSIYYFFTTNCNEEKIALICSKI